jgi:hypothetical protein
MEKYEQEDGDGDNRRSTPRTAGLGLMLLLGILLMVGTVFFHPAKARCHRNLL